MCFCLSAYYKQKRVEDIIIQSPPPKLHANTWSQQFHSFLELCLKKDPAERWSAEQLLQHPFIAGLPPKKIIRAEIQKHLQAQHRWPAKRGEGIHCIWYDCAIINTKLRSCWAYYSGARDNEHILRATSP
ncbi:hypothetical protein XENTR_v10016180 [Xenopus tropicalis]|nr:hypothetical protein XENTR_v10016180 [Xenopus tropicalis]